MKTEGRDEAGMRRPQDPLRPGIPPRHEDLLRQGDLLRQRYPMRPRCPLILGACAVSLVTGCAQMGAPVDAQGPRVEAVYRVQQPAGTAAGQYAIGRMDLAEGRAEAAISRFRQALRIDPNFVEAHNGLGVAYDQVGRFAEAIEAFRGALASGPAAAHVLGNLGFAQLKAGQLDEASNSLRRSHDLDPENEHTRANIRLLAEARRERFERESAARADAADSADAIVLTPVTTGSVARASAAAAVGTSVDSAPRESPGSVSRGATGEPVTHEPVAAKPSAVITLLARVSAAKALGEAPNLSAYEIVRSESGSEALVQVSPGIYELRAPVGASAGSGSTSPIARSTPPSHGSILMSPNAGAISHRVARAPFVPPAWTVAGDVSPPSREPVQVSAVPARTAELRSASIGAPAQAEAAAAAKREAGARAEGAEAAAGAKRVAGAPGAPEVPGVPGAPGAPGQAGAVVRASFDPKAVAPVLAEARASFGSKVVTPVLAEPAGGDLLLAGLDGFEVSNGVGLDRLATRTAREFSRLGAKVARVSNYTGYGKRQTEIHYRAGHEDGARAVQQYLSVVATLIETAQMRGGVNVRLVVGRDMVAGPIAGSDQNGRPALDGQSHQNPALAPVALR